MVKLEDAIDGVIFYFHNINDCKAFLYVFKDHWCNVPWKEPIEAAFFPEMTNFQRKEMDKDPKQRAENNLSWGFSLERLHNLDLTAAQKAFVDGFINKII